MDEMSESPVAPEVARGVQVPAPKRKRAYYRAIEDKRDIPGLLAFQYKLMIKRTTEAMIESLYKEITTPSPFLGLLDATYEPHDGSVKVEWGKE